MKDSLVSVISPCYNKAFSLDKFIRSIIDQDYRPIELIIVDDGSTDSSWDILQSMKSECNQTGILTIFLHQANQGVSGAINTALTRVNGEFLCWPDCDDWLDSTSIRKRVQFLQENNRFDIVTSNAFVFKENDLTHPIGMIATDDCRFREQQFNLMLNGKSIVCPGCHMVRTEALFTSMGGNQIFPSRYGQNLQLLLPILYHSPRGFIDEPLYNYVNYIGSLSHYQRTFERVWAHREGRYQIKLETINHISGMKDKERKKALRTVSVNEARYRLQIAKEFKKKEIAKRQLFWLFKLRALSPADILVWFSTMAKVLTDNK